MDILNIDVQANISDIIDAYTKVYGPEYREVIEKRINQIFYIVYNDVDGISDYLTFLKECKKKELAIKFLEKIGIDIKEYQPKSYAENLNENIINLMNKYIILLPGLRNWPDKIKIRGKSRKHSRVLEQISKEYEEYLQKLEPYQKYVIEELERRTDIQERTITDEEAQREFIYNSKEFIKIAEMFNDTPDNKEAIYTIQKNKMICITDVANDEGFSTILFFTLGKSSGGIIDYLLLHEMCHAIETDTLAGNGRRCGFEVETNVANDIPLNPYNSQKRKYERLNETITDIFAIEARKILHEKGIYMFEPQNHIIEKVNNRNTSSIVKNLLTKFMKKYRSPIIKARLLGDMKGLYDVIGKENFESLNDVVNKVDSLEELSVKIKNNQRNDPDVVEYCRQLERLKQIYNDMEKYQSKKHTTNDEPEL